MLLTLGWQETACVWVGGGGEFPSCELFLNNMHCPIPCVCVLLLLVSRSELMLSCLAVQWLNACLSSWPHCFIATHTFLWKNWGGLCKWNHSSCPCLPFHFLLSVLCPPWSVVCCFVLVFCWWFLFFFFLWAFLLATLPMLCRTLSKLSTVKRLLSSYPPVLDPLSCVQREIAVVLIIVVKLLHAASFLCEVLLL